MPSDFVLTIDSDDDDYPSAEPRAESSSRGRKTTALPTKNGTASNKAEDGVRDDDLNPDFEFDFGGERSEGLDLWGGDEVKRTGKEGNGPLSVDDIIARRTGKAVRSFKDRKRKRGDQGGEADVSSEEDEDEDEEEDGSDDADQGVGEADGEESDVDVGMMSDADNDDSAEDGESEAEDDDEDEDEDEDEGMDFDMGMDGSDEDEAEAGPASQSDEDNDVSEPEDEATLARKAAFFSSDPLATTTSTTGHDDTAISFSSMNLSRPLLRSLTALNFSTPTPIQARAIPLALLGRDILGSAVTGSGKTAAFMIPILERLTYRDRGRGGQACRVLVLCPTRELAVQCEAVGRSLAEKGGLDVRFALLVGGLSLAAQAHTLRTLPDILIATPGRLIDHLTNTPSFTLGALDVLVMDEADRMLEDGFADELTEIIRACPRNRQTMLFSATMTDSVDELVKLSLDKPIRVFVDPKKSTADSLTQEFVRIRQDEHRAPALLTLCKRTVRERCIVFFRSKALAHQMRVVFGLLGLKAAELHGNLTQEQRLTALNDFKSGRVDFLLATDLASRGLDIRGVETVINYDMPGQLAQYTHRVGRTARAGRKGRSISLVGEPDRKMLKLAIRQSAGTSSAILHRIVPPASLSAMSARLAALKPDVEDILKEEKEEKALRTAEMEVKKGENMVAHEDEIMGRPRRVWFQSEKEKMAAKTTGKADYLQKFPTAPAPTSSSSADKRAPKRGKYDGLSRRDKRRKMALEADEAEGRGASQAASIRKAKKEARPGKIGVLSSGSGIGGGKSGSKGGQVGVGKKKRSAFDGPAKKGATGSGGAGAGQHEGMRAKQVKVNLTKKGKFGGSGGGGGGKGKGGKGGSKGRR